MECLICKRDSAIRESFCDDCRRARVFTCYLADQFFFPRRVERVLYHGPDSGEACDVMDATADQLYRQGREKYFVAVTDQHGFEVASVSR